MKSQTRFSPRKHLFAALAGAGALAGLMAVTVPAYAHPDAEGGTSMQARHGDRKHGPEAHGKRMERMVERVFDKVGASAEQKARALDIVRASGEEMKKLHESRPDDRKDMLALLSADTLDRAAIEQQRQTRQTHMEEASKLMTRTMTDLAEVLTPAQRKEAAKALASFGRGPGGHKGHGHHRHGDGPRPPEAPRG